MSRRFSIPLILLLVLESVLVTGCASSAQFAGNQTLVDVSPVERLQLTALTFHSLNNEQRRDVTRIMVREQQEYTESLKEQQAAGSNFGDQALAGTVGLEAARPLTNQLGESLMENTGMGAGGAALTLTVGMEVANALLFSAATTDSIGELSLPAVAMYNGIEYHLTDDDQALAFGEQYLRERAADAIEAMGGQMTCADGCDRFTRYDNGFHGTIFEVTWPDGARSRVEAGLMPPKAESAMHYRNGAIAGLKKSARGFDEAYSTSVPGMIYGIGSAYIGFAKGTMEAERYRAMLAELQRIASGADGYLVLGKRVYGARYLAFKQTLYQIDYSYLVEARVSR